MKPKTNRAGDQYVARKFDLCQTPGYAVAPILPYLRSDWIVWEPAHGEGLMVEALRPHVYHIFPTDIQTGPGFNFFDYQPAFWSVLVTNPPYSIKYKWLRRCYALGKPFALLLPVETLGAAQAQVLFREHGVEVIFLSKRVNFKMPDKGWLGKGAQFSVAWFTWQFGIGREMSFAEIHPTKPVSEHQLTLLEA